MTFVACTWGLVLCAGWVLLRDLLLPSRSWLYGVANGSLFLVLAALALVAHVRTVLTDPGAVPLEGPPSPDAVQLCPYCGCARPRHAYHCFECGRCIRRVDHHCIWVNNCVGEDNRKYFLLFTLYIGLTSLHLLLLLGICVVQSYMQGLWNWHSPVSVRGSLLFLFFVSLMGLFLGFMMFSIQMYTLCTDKTATKWLQRGRNSRRKGCRWAKLKAVCGPRLSLAWLNPCAPPELQRPAENYEVV